MQNAKDALKNRGQGLLVVDADTTMVDESCFYLAEVNGKARLVTGADVTTRVLGRVLLVIMTPRQAGQVHDALDV